MKKDTVKTKQTSLHLPPKLRAWAGWQGTAEGYNTLSKFIIYLLTQYHAKCAREDPRIPPID